MADHDAPATERMAVYLLKSQEARRLALTASDPQARQSFELLADCWEQLARQVSRDYPLQ